MSTITEKGGSTLGGIKLLLCENPLPPIKEAIEAAQAEVPHSNYYTEPYSAPLRRLISEQIGVSERHIHINAGSELILRQLFDRFGQQVHLLTPTYALFQEIALHCAYAPIRPKPISFWPTSPPTTPCIWLRHWSHGGFSSNR